MQNRCHRIDNVELYSLGELAARAHATSRLECVHMPDNAVLAAGIPDFPATGGCHHLFQFWWYVSSRCRWIASLMVPPKIWVSFTVLPPLQVHLGTPVPRPGRPAADLGHEQGVLSVPVLAQQHWLRMGSSFAESFCCTSPRTFIGAHKDQHGMHMHAPLIVTSLWVARSCTRPGSCGCLCSRSTAC